MRITALFFFLCFALPGLCQIPGIKSIKPYTTCSGYELKVGDSLIIGFGSTSSEAFRHIFVPPSLVSNELYHFPKSATGSILPIKYFKHAVVEGKEMVYAVVPSGGNVPSFQNAAIEIENAFRTGEVFCKQSQIFNSKNYTPFTDEVALLQVVKLKRKEPADIAEEYLRRVHPVRYMEIDENEFVLRKEIRDIIPVIKAKADSLQDSTVYKFTSKVHLSEYDFDKKGFPLEIPYAGISALTYIGFPNETQANIVFTNASNFSLFPISETIAEQLFTYKTTMGVTDRWVYLRINFKITGSEEESNNLVAEIIDIEVYGNWNRYSYDLGIIKKP